MPPNESESWLCLMHAVALLRVPLVFGRAHAEYVTLSEDGAVATRTEAYSTEDEADWRAAASTVSMRSGRRFARFTTVEGSKERYVMFGVIRADWNLEGDVAASDVILGRPLLLRHGGRVPIPR